MGYENKFITHINMFLVLNTQTETQIINEL